MRLRLRGRSFLYLFHGHRTEIGASCFGISIAFGIFHESTLGYLRARISVFFSDVPLVCWHQNKFWEFSECITQEVITFWDKWDKITYCRMWQQSLTRHLQDIDDCTCGIDVIVTATNALDHFWIHLSVDYCLHQSKAGTGIILWSRALVYLHIVPYIVGSVRKEAQQLLRWRTAFTRWMWHKT